MELLKNSFILYIYLFIAISVGWYYNHIGKNYVKKYNIVIMILIETIVVLTCIVIYLGYKYKFTTDKIIKELGKISFMDYCIFASFAAYGAISSILGMRFLKYHDVAKIRISDFIISIPISAFGLYYFSEEKITHEKLVGLLLVLGGGFLFLK